MLDELRKFPSYPGLLRFGQGLFEIVSVNDPEFFVPRHSAVFTVQLDDPIEMLRIILEQRPEGACFQVNRFEDDAVKVEDDCLQQTALLRRGCTDGVSDKSLRGGSVGLAPDPDNHCRPAYVRYWD